MGWLISMGIAGEGKRTGLVGMAAVGIIIVKAIVVIMARLLSFSLSSW
jgi:hypothetical protein